jgi:hypothetical protein
VYEKYKFSLPVKTNKRLKTRVANPMVLGRENWTR